MAEITYNDPNERITSEDDEERRRQLLEQARGIYGANWDADAQQNFENRARQQDPETLLANTRQEHYDRYLADANDPTRFSSGGGGGSVTQQWTAQPAPPPDPRSTELFGLLLDRARQGTAVSREDPMVRAQVDPMVAQQERSSRNYLDTLAERGGPLANLQGEQRLAAERTGQAAGTLEAEVIGREIGARRDEIQQALSLYGNLLNADQTRGLQRELAMLQDAQLAADRMLRSQLGNRGLDLQAQGLDQSQDQFLRELALREWDLGNQWDARWGGL